MKDLLRKIPRVDDILRHNKWKGFTGPYPEKIAREGLNAVLDALRAGIRSGKITSIPAVADIISAAHKEAEELVKPKLKRVINCTGVILHTNLGRSLLSRSAIEGILNASSYYTNLEYNLEKGTRGERYTHCANLLTRITGAEDALIVNNNAAAVYLVLNTMAEGREAVISRGELVEIGGSFRIPEVMRKSGVALREVGTTNKTHRDDYEQTINEETALILRIHTSNFRIRGFTHTPEGEELIDLGRRYNVPTFFDAGSGLLCSLGAIGVREEPIIHEEVKRGYDVISFSADKLLGGPQAGIIVGKKIFIDAMKKNPLLRALRPDKFTLAALEATLLIYRDPEQAVQDLPTLSMIHRDMASLVKQAEHLIDLLRTKIPSFPVKGIKVQSEVGGGTLPDVTIPSYGIAIRPERITVEELETRLRNLDIPIIGRIEKNMLILDMRTVLAEDEHHIVNGMGLAYGNE